MRRRGVLMVAAIAVIAGCATPPTPSTRPEASTSASTPVASATTAGWKVADLPRIDGSTANIPLISLVIQRLTGTSAADADNMVHTTGTPSAYRNLVNGDTDLLLVYEPDRDTKTEIADSSVSLESYPIGRDALVFFTNASNPVASLSTRQYRDIYTGQVKNWSKVGGKNATIVAYQRPEASGSQALLRKYVVGDAKLAKAPSELISGEMGEIIDGVSSYANSGNALGYSVYYYLANMYAVDGIKMLAVSGVEPSKQTIASGQYPYTNDFFAVIRSDAPADSPARKVLAWLRSDAGAQTVVDAGYVAAPR